MAQPPSQAQIRSLIEHLPQGLDPDPEKAIGQVLQALHQDGWEVGRSADQPSLDLAQWAFLRVESVIAAATPKAVIVLSLHGLLLSGAFLQGRELLSRLRPPWQVVVGVILGLFLTSAATTLWLVFRTVAPRVAPREGKPSLLLFSSIAGRSRTEFAQSFRTSSRAELFADLVDELHALAGLAAWKHRLLVQAFRLILWVEVPLLGALALAWVWSSGS